MEQEEERLYHISTAVSSERLPHFIAQVLKPQLPHSLPLLRRCQYHATQAHQAVNAEIWLATATDRATFDAQPRNGEQVIEATADNPWLAAHIDLSNAGQTQVWTFGSWEAAFSDSEDPISSMQESGDFSTHRHLFRVFFDHLRKEHISKLSRDPPLQWQRLKESGKMVSVPFSRSKVLFGTLARCHWYFLDDNGIASDRGISREDSGYLKYILKSRAASLVTTDAPDTFRFAPMEEIHLQTILDRTNIPRTIETLRQLHIVGLFNKANVPAAWGMLGKDASISSLQTETEYRRQGLAEAVSKRLLADQIRLFVDEIDPAAPDAVVYSHADVSETNVASRKVMDKLGGKVMWKVAWIEVDLGEDMLPV